MKNVIDVKENVTKVWKIYDMKKSFFVAVWF